MWPHWNTKSLTAEAMTHAGWRYTPTEQHRDAVECPFCDLKAYNWMDGHDPLRHHQKHSPRCPWIHQIYPLVPPVKQPTLADLISELRLMRRDQEQVNTRLDRLEARSPPSKPACVTPAIKEAPAQPLVQPTLHLQATCQDESDEELLEEVADESTESRSPPQSMTVKPRRFNGSKLWRLQSIGPMTHTTSITFITIITVIDIMSLQLRHLDIVIQIRFFIAGFYIQQSDQVTYPPT